MATLGNRLKEKLGLLIFIGIYVVVFSILLLPVAILLKPCISETKNKILDQFGFDIYIVRRTCGPIVTTEWVEVLISKRRYSNRVLLFAYFPELNYKNNYTILLPTVRFLSPHTLSISLSEAGQILFRRYEWEGLSIEYDIGSVSYPESVGDKSRGN